MTDEPRDPQLGAALEVPPLAETTRRRLVRSAVAAAGAPGEPEPGAPRSLGRMGAAIGVAAALLVGAVVGAIVVTSPDDPETTTAAKATGTEPTTAAVEGAAPAAPSADEVASAPTITGASPQELPPQDLGDLGAVSGEDGLRRAIGTAFQQAGSERAAAAGDAGIPCSTADPALLGLVLITAAGTADFDGTPVVVLVGPTPRGDDIAVVQDPGRGCEILRRVTL